MTTLRPFESSYIRRATMPAPRRCACGGTAGLAGECERCRQKRMQRKERGTVPARRPGQASSPTVEQTLRSPGRPLEAGTRADMEGRFGHDFSRVRVHTDARAAESARAVDAFAYTVGPHVVFGAGRYAPGSPAGRRLLAHELTHVVQQQGTGASSPAAETVHEGGAEAEAAAAAQRVAGGGGALTVTGRLATPAIQKTGPTKPSTENVWGFQVDRSMCKCRPNIVADMQWSDHAAASYAKCDVPANPSGDAVEKCFEAANPTSVVVASTSASGAMTLPPPSADPCERVSQKASAVHEIMHSRHTDALARLRGTPFFAEWLKLAGDPNRVDTIQKKYPTETAKFLGDWTNGHDWARDEVHSYTWERRFLSDALSALRRICP